MENKAMASENPSLRHVKALVNQVMGEEPVQNLLRQGLEAVLKAVMEAEVSEITGVTHGQRAGGERKTHRNGYRTRTFQTGLGTSYLQIPKVRQGTCFPSFLRAHKRSDDALLVAIASCYQQGVSTRNVEAIAQALGIDSMKKSQVSDIVQALDPQVSAFQERPLGGFTYVWFDARYEHVREDGMREVLGFEVQRVENEAYWDDFLRGLVERGLTGVRLAISDAHEGLRRAIEKRLPTAQWQRCRVHFMRNLAQRVGKRQRPALMAVVKTIFAQECHEKALAQRQLVAASLRRSGLEEVALFLETTNAVLTYLLFPSAHWSKLHSTNVIERLNRELKRRTRVVSIFPNRAALTRLVGALLLEEHEEWLVARRYIAEQSMAQARGDAPELGAEAVLLLEAAK